VTAPVDPRVERCRPDARRYAALLGQLALVLAALHLFRLEGVVG
jgi:hypothetical protein